MAEEIQEGQPTPTPMAPPEGIPAVPAAPAEPTPTPPQPSGGRSVDELFNEMEELKRLNAELADKAARAEHEATYTRNLIENLRTDRPQRETEQKPAPIDISDDEYLTAPGKAMSRGFMALEERLMGALQRRELEAKVERAKSLFETGKRSTLEKGNKLFQGIENEVAQEIQRGIISGAIQPEAATDPTLWEVTAMAIRYANRKERSFDKYFAEHKTPMSPGHQETPTPSGPPKAEMTLSPEQEELISRTGITREQFLQNWAKVRAGEQERNR